jgi:hypothetical protein
MTRRVPGRPLCGVSRAGYRVIRAGAHVTGREGRDEA